MVKLYSSLSNFNFSSSVKKKYVRFLTNISQTKLNSLGDKSYVSPPHNATKITNEYTKGLGLTLYIL